MKSRYQMFAGYNAWCNERLYDAAAKVADAEYRHDRGAFFFPTSTRQLLGGLRPRIPLPLGILDVAYGAVPGRDRFLDVVDE